MKSIMHGAIRIIGEGQGVVRMERKTGLKTDNF
jgi:hypothetical protein